MPSGHNWKKENQGKSNIAYENQYGFGGEEWLFNPRYKIGEYQYGYIRGAMGLSKLDVVKRAVLFTFNQKTKEKFIVGEINNLEIVNEGTHASDIANDLIDKYFFVMENELKEINADYKGFNKMGFLANVRFKTENLTAFDELLPIPMLDTSIYKRFNPYKIEGKLEQILEGCLPTNQFIFRSGIAKNTNKYSRSIPSSKKEIERIHSEITNDIIKFLNPHFCLDAKNISVEKTVFGNNTADIVLQHEANKISIIEVKSSDNVRKNIRDAVGQLLDYALWYHSIEIIELIIVAPNILKENELALMERIQSAIRLKLSFWQWNGNATEIEEKIVKIL